MDVKIVPGGAVAGVEGEPAAASSHSNANVAHFPRLSQSSLTTLPPAVATPAYNRSAVTAGIVHLGTGNFALAHLASYVDDLLAKDPRWGIAATSLRSPRTITALDEQDGLYVLVERQRDQRRYRVMGPVVETMFGAERVAERIASPHTKLVTITVSNEGYCMLSHAMLDWRKDDLAADLSDPSQPRSLYGFIANGLERRRAHHPDSPLTVMSLDNVPDNSRTFKKGLLEFLTRTGRKDLAQWVNEHVDFPVTLVDRITPRTDAQLIAEATAHLGIESQVVVATEAFRQLVIERSRFPMPDFAAVGAKVVDKAEPYWRRKFYLVNAGHQVPAICGQRLGLTYIYEAMEQGCIARLLERAHDEWQTILEGDPAELKEYCATVRERFLDPSLGDTIERVAARATSKVSERLLSSVEVSYLGQGDLLKVPVFMTAVWLHNLGRLSENGRHLHLADSEAPKLQELHQDVMDWAKQASLRRLKQSYPKVREFLARLEGILLEPRYRRLAADDGFVRELAWSLIKISHCGLKAAARGMLRKRKAAPRPTLTHVLFDCDGVLVQSEHLAFTACCQLVNEVLASHGVEKRFSVHELMNEFVGCNFRRMIVELSKRYQFAVPDEELERLVLAEEDRVIAKLSEAVQACTGVNDALAALHGKFGLAVVSSSAKRRVLACLQKVGQTAFFPEAQVYSAATSLAVPQSKPHPAVYLHAVEQLMTTSDRCVAIEDSKSGVIAAVKAGIAVIGYVGSYPVAERKKMAAILRESGAFTVIDSHRKTPAAIRLFAARGRQSGA